MPTLTAEQRKLITTRLDVWPKPRGMLETIRANLFQDHVREDTEIVAALDDLEAADKAVAEAVADIEGLNRGPVFGRAVARFKASVAELQDALLRVDRVDGLLKIKDATRQLASLQSAMKGALADPDLCVADFTAYEAGVQDAEDRLKEADAHPQTAHVAGEIAKARVDLAAAHRVADGGDYDAAARAAQIVAAGCAGAIKIADDYAAKVLPVLRTATRALDSLKKYLDAGAVKTHEEAIKKALAKADAPARDYPGATGDLGAAIAQLKAAAVTELSGPIKNHMDALGAHAGGLAAFVADDIKRLGDLKKEVDDAIGRDDVPLAVMIVRGAVNAQRIVTLQACERRKKYESKRKDTEAELGKAKPHAALLGAELTKLETALADADLKASRAQMRIEEAIAALWPIESACVDRRALAACIEGYRTARSDVETRLAALKAPPQAAGTGPSLTALDGMLAALPPGTAMADNHSADLAVWEKALRGIGQAKAAVAKTEEMAAGLREVAVAGVPAGREGDLDEVRRAAQALLALIVTTEAHAQAGEVTGRTGAAKTQAGSALSMIEAIAANGEMGGMTVRSAAGFVADASRLLDLARIDLAELKAFQERKADLSAGRDALATSKSPPASSIRSKLDELDRLLAEAAVQAKAKAWDAAATAHAAAEEALADARGAASARDGLDVHATAVRSAIKMLSGPPAAAFELDVVAAEALAGTYDFAGAKAALDKVANAVDVALLAAMASDPKKVKASDKDFVDGTFFLLTRPGGDKALDDLVSKLPNDFPSATLCEIANRRFDVTVKIEGPLKTDAHDEMKSGRRIYEMLAMVPEHVKGNASLLEVRRDKADGSGGYYSEYLKLAVVTGRPLADTQKFGANLLNSDGNPQLGPVDSDHQPENEDAVDFFDYATLHEVGHAVDARLNFMAKNEGVDAYGGWITYGDIAPIVDAVAAHCGYATGPQKAYIKDLMLGLNPEPPQPSPVDAVAWAAGLKKVQDWHAKATNKKIWWQEAESRSICIDKRIYQEAYPGQWVSYLDKARDTGMTGYQFRAPGEWFAELYACYHSKKLKKDHTARTWLETL